MATRAMSRSIRTLKIITDAAASPANTGDGQLTGRLTADLDHAAAGDGDGRDGSAAGHTPASADVEDHEDDEDNEGAGDEPDGPAVYGDAAYGSGEQLAALLARRIDARVKTQPPARRNGRFSKADFTIDLDADTVTCPASATVPIVRADDGSGVARFGRHCDGCPLRGRCTDAARGRSINVHRHEALLARQRARVTDPDWLADCRSTRPKVERKLAHLVQRGRKAARRGLQRVDADWSLLAGAIHLTRLVTLGLQHTEAAPT